jgi:hypothetical protein
MSLESFAGFDNGEGMSEAAFEAFKERMKAAAAQIAAIKKEEKRAKKNEDELLEILLEFIKTSQKTRLVLFISRALEQNIPANFILAIIVLGNIDIQNKIGIKLIENSENLDEGDGKSLIFFREDQTMPLKVRIELDSWMKGLLFQAEESPGKLLKTAYKRKENIEEKEEIKPELIELSAYIVGDYLKQKNMEENSEKMTNFTSFILSGILKKTKENYEERKQID